MNLNLLLSIISIFATFLIIILLSILNHNDSRDNFLRMFRLVPIVDISRVKSLIRLLNINEKIYLVENDNLLFAFTFGIFKPAICLSTGLCYRLSDDELKAVLLHERSHIEKKHNLKMTLFYFLNNLFFFVPGRERRMSNLFLIYEEDTDETTIKCLGQPYSLLSALLKICRLNQIELNEIKYCLPSLNGATLKNRIEHILEICS